MTAEQRIALIAKLEAAGYFPDEIAAILAIVEETLEPRT